MATNEDPRPVTTGAFVKSLNDVIDSQGRRNALLQMHVPEIVLILLFIVFASSGGTLGYSNGLTWKAYCRTDRPGFAINHFNRFYHYRS